MAMCCCYVWLLTFGCACRAGICSIVPPPGWAPPFALEKGTNGMSAESFRFLIRRQLTSHLCMRLPNTSRRRKAAASGRSGLLCAVACTRAVWLLSLMQTCLQTCVLSSATPADFWGKSMLQVHGSCCMHFCNSAYQCCRPCHWAGDVVMHERLSVSICNAPGNAQAGYGRCHSHITSELNQF